MIYLILIIFFISAINNSSTCRIGFDLYDCHYTKSCSNITKKCSCPSVDCRKLCDKGWIRGADGCQKCFCAKEKEKTNLIIKNCPGVTCRLKCKHGFRQLENGCEICRCRNSKEAGGKLDKLGAKCRPGFDYFDCEEGFSCNELSQRCTCHEEKCRTYCANGFKNDENGCEFCSCRSKKEERKNNLAKGACPGVRCDVECLYGYKTNDLGCKVCRCLESNPTTFVPKLPKCKWWQRTMDKFRKKKKCAKQ